MANWYGTCRTNYVKAKDPDAFENYLSNFDLTIIKDSENRIGFYANGDGNCPEFWDDNTYDNISVVTGLSDHLAEGEVMIIMEVGAEKQRYVTGWAMAINHEGDTEEISLNQIYRLAQDTWGTENITPAEY